MATLNDIVSQVIHKVSQTTTVDDTSEEYGLITSFTNQSQQEAWDAYDWPFKYAEYNTRTSTSTGNCSIALPANFGKLAGYPNICDDGTVTSQFLEIEPYDREQYDTSKRYAYVLNDSGVNTLIVHPVTTNGQLASGASIYIPYYKSLSSLVSPANSTQFPHTDYLVKRTIAHIWEAREDGRYPTMKADADNMLGRIIEEVTSRGVGYMNAIPTANDKYNFRIGKD